MIRVVVGMFIFDGKRKKNQRVYTRRPRRRP